MQNDKKTMLNVENLAVSYGLIKAVKGVNFYVNEGEIVALIGANGAGKTTIMHAVNCLIPKTSGKVTFDGKDISAIAARKLNSLGLTQVPEGRRIFSELSVKENLMLGAYTVKNQLIVRERLERVYQIFPRLKEREKQDGGTLSGGEQQMLAVGRAMMSNPKMLLLDEPSMGLSPLFVNVIFDTIKKIKEEGTTVLVVEQNAKKALSIADRAYVLETGSIVAEGRGEELLLDEKIKKAYLGE